MRIMVVDDEALALKSMLTLLKKVIPKAMLIGFMKPSEAFTYLQEHFIDIAFMDVEMGGLDGITLAKTCKNLCPKINIIFVTGYAEYAMEALKLHASGYLLKPVQEKDLLAEIQNLRYPLSDNFQKKVRVQTFGNFEIFVDGIPLKLSLSKCKECLAYLIDRKGAYVSMAELSSILWENKLYDRATQNHLHQVLYVLKKILKSEGILDILIRSRGKIAIDPAKLDCDYYQAINGDISQMNLFTGEYMSNYSWAEFTLAELERKK